jgi:hypothetical protein
MSFATEKNSENSCCKFLKYEYHSLVDMEHVTQIVVVAAGTDAAAAAVVVCGGGDCAEGSVTSGGIG